MVKKCFLTALYTALGYFSVPVLANSQTDDFKPEKHIMGQEGSQYSDSTAIYAILCAIATFAPLIITIALSSRYARKQLKRSWPWWLSLFSSVVLIVVVMFYLITSVKVTS
mgnify:CR=1 FL=1